MAVVTEEDRKLDSEVKAEKSPQKKESKKGVIKYPVGKEYCYYGPGVDVVVDYENL